jgi:site-specific DNA-methyltransferase (adenine-specific)
MNAKWHVAHGAAEEVLPTLELGSVGATITDPPSGIGFMGAEWDHHKGGRAQWVAWLASVLTSARAATKPGGRALVWSLPRTSHWTGAAVEEAGWAIETHVAHLFGQGWPKAKTQLKPAHELWWLARTGPSEPLGIDACRVGTSKEVPATTGERGLADLGCGWGLKPKADTDGRDPSTGRWPPTVVTSHTPWCRCVGARKVRAGSFNAGGGSRPSGFFDTGSASGDGKPCAPGYADPDGTETVDAWECVEGCPVAIVGEASGERKSGAMRAGTPRKNLDSFTGGFSPSRATASDIVASGGTAARFFPQFPAVDPQEPCPIVYAGKVPPSERWVSAVCGCGVRVQLLSDAEPTTERRDGGLFCTRCNLARVHHVHPTQKSVALMRWFVRLVSAPGDLILDPFAGSGTTGVAALLEGRRFLGIERDEHHHAVACARLERAAWVPIQADLFGGSRTP